MSGLLHRGNEMPCYLHGIDIVDTSKGTREHAGRASFGFIYRVTWTFVLSGQKA
jgi:hypothetical protein